MQLSPTSPANSLGLSVPATRLRDPIATTTQQTKSPSLFERLYNEHVRWIYGNDKNRQETHEASMFSEATFESLKTPIPQIDTGDMTVTQNNLQTPIVCSAPEKKRIGHYTA